MDQKKWKEIMDKEPIPNSILEKMEYLRRRGETVIADKYIKRPTMIEGIRKASALNTLVLNEVKKMVVSVPLIVLKDFRNMCVHQ